MQSSTGMSISLSSHRTLRPPPPSKGAHLFQAEIFICSQAFTIRELIAFRERRIRVLLPSVVVSALAFYSQDYVPTNEFATIYEPRFPLRRYFPFSQNPRIWMGWKFSEESAALPAARVSETPNPRSLNPDLCSFLDHSFLRFSCAESHQWCTTSSEDP